MPWYEEWFGRDEYELVYQQHDASEAEQIVDLIEQIVTPDAAARILDVGCGRGRHARVLAQRGYRVTGLDLSERAIEQARRRTEAADRALDFHVQDMRAPMGEAGYDGVVNLFTAFGYFENDADHRRALRHMADALHPNGWFVQDFMNTPHVIETLVPEDIRTEDGVRIEQRRWVEDGRINKTITLHQNGSTRTFRESVRLFTLYDFEQLYEDVGLALVDTYGDYEGGLYTPESPRLIMHAVKT